VQELAASVLRSMSAASAAPRFPAPAPASCGARHMRTHVLTSRPAGSWRAHRSILASARRSTGGAGSTRARPTAPSAAARNASGAAAAGAAAPAAAAAPAVAASAADCAAVSVATTSGIRCPGKRTPARLRLGRAPCLAYPVAQRTDRCTSGSPSGEAAYACGTTPWSPPPGQASASFSEHIQTPCISVCCCHGALTAPANRSAGDKGRAGARPAPPALRGRADERAVRAKVGAHDAHGAVRARQHALRALQHALQRAPHAHDAARQDGHARQPPAHLRGAACTARSLMRWDGASTSGARGRMQ